MSSVEMFKQSDSKQNVPVTREELYAEVWQLPMTKVAERLIGEMDAVRVLMDWKGPAER